MTINTSHTTYYKISHTNGSLVRRRQLNDGFNGNNQQEFKADIVKRKCIEQYGKQSISHWLGFIVALFTLIAPNYHVVHADDIEVYTGGSSSVKANVAIIIDTSGSMSAYANPGEGGDIIPYDPSKTYDNDRYGFDSNAIYIYRYNDLSVTLSDNLAEHIKQFRINTDSLSCNPALEAIASTGQYIGRLKYWRPGQTWYDYDAGWSAPYPTFWGYQWPTVYDNASHIVDCEAGNPHDYQGSVYNYLRRNNWDPRDRTEPYTDSRRRRISWNNEYYTHVWSGNFLNYLSSPDSANTKKHRLDVVREAAIDVVNSVEGINVALVRFSADSRGGFIDLPMTSSSEAGDLISDKLFSYDPAGGTPIEETLYETYQYLKGENVTYGQNSKSVEITNLISRSEPDGTYSNYEYEWLDTPSVDASRVNASNQYAAPNALECTPTKIVLFSDGVPTEDTGANQVIRSLIADTNLEAGLDKDCSGNGDCAEEFAYFMSKTDHRPDVEGVQSITVDTIGGFLFDEGSSSTVAAKTKLKDIADASDGAFYLANNYTEIFDALSKSLTSVITSPSTFTSPTVAVNSFNSLENSDQLYFSVFEPSNRPSWQGNLKRYRISSDEEVVGIDDNSAVDGETGFFRETAISYWANKDDLGNWVVDGSQVSIGGAADRLTVPRTIYTSINGQLDKLPVTTSGVASGALTLDGVLNSSLISILTKDKLGITHKDDLYHKSLISWIIGYDQNLSVRTSMEDPLHSQPLVINYGAGDATLFVATNSGYLHAIDIDQDSGKEIFSFIPEELLQIPYVYYDQSSETGETKYYGLDGSLSYWHDDQNLDGTVNGADKLYVYIGMRRGGHSYYALDVTDRNNPVLLWQKNGIYKNFDRLNSPTVSSGYENMGQTWSQLIPAEVMWNGSKRVVLFAGGGYDSAEDGPDIEGVSTRIKHTVGNTVYMIDAVTGEILWDALKNLNLNSVMTSSFPSDVVPLDRDADGLVDLLYAADVGGRIWRFDFNSNNSSATNFAQGGIIADLNDGTESGNRRFFNSPDISYIDKAPQPFILISIGSGYRAHPLVNTVNDMHFLLKDRYGMGVPTTYDKTLTDDLARWGSTGLSENDYGWYIPLSALGEKELSRSVTFQGTVLFSTYAPKSPDQEVFCGGDVGNARIYMVNLYEPTVTEKVSELEQGGIPPSPTFLTTPAKRDPEGNIVTEAGQSSCEGSEAIILVGPEVVDIDASRCDIVDSDYWREQPPNRIANEATTGGG